MLSEKDYCMMYIVRHGETEANIKKNIIGQTDTPLTQNGLIQVNQLKEKFKDIHFDEVFSSDLLRAQRTAEIITIEKDLIIKTSKLLRERTCGDFEGGSAK